MRRLMIGVLLLTLLLACTGCSETMRTTQDLVDKAREEIPIADAQTTFWSTTRTAPHSA